MNLIEEVRQLVDGKPTEVIYGALSHRSFRRSPSVEGQIVIFEFDCWRLLSGSVTKKTLVLRGLVNQIKETLISELLPGAVVQVKAKLNEENSLGFLEEVVGKHSSDQELNECANRLGSPFEFEDSELGIFMWDTCCVFEGECSWNGASMKLLLDLEDIRDTEVVSLLCDKAKDILKSQEQ